jgi:NADH dehydrogenase
MKVLLLGGTGFIGTELAHELVDRGHEVRVLSRSPEDEDLPSAVETVTGDVTAYDSIESAFEGQDAAVFLVALEPLFTPSGGEKMHEKVHLGGTKNAVRAAEEHGVERFVQMSALGADPDGATHYIRSKGQAEDVVRESDLDWTIFRPSIVYGDGSGFLRFTGLLTTPFVTAFPGGGSIPFQPIWVGDLAPMMADALEDEKHVGQAYDVGGPEVLTLADVARAIERSKGRSLAVLPIPMPLVKIGATVTGALPLIPFGPDQYRSLQFDNRVQDNGVTAFGYDTSDLRTLDDYLGIANGESGTGTPDSDSDSDSAASSA